MEQTNQTAAPEVASPSTTETVEPKNQPNKAATKKKRSPSKAKGSDGLTANQRKVLNKMDTKSAKIRYLTNLDWSRGKIAKFLGILYQHVRNVQITPVKSAK